MLGVTAMSLCACGEKATEETAKTVEATQETEEETKISDREDYVGYADLNVSDYVTLADYASMTVQAEQPEVTDADIESYINGNILTSYLITDRAVAEGDVALIDYEGKKDGVAFDGGTAQNQSLNIGSGAFIEGFEEGLVGVMPGETVDLNLTFPEDYFSEDMAGAEVVFTVTVHGIQVTTDYENVTEEQIAAMELEYTTKEEIWEAAAKTVEENAKSTFETNSMNAIVAQIVEESDFPQLPELLVAEEVQNYKSYLESMYAMYYGCDLETYVTTYSGTTMEQFEQDINSVCQEYVKVYLVIESVARAEGIEITKEQLKELAQQDAAAYGYESADALLEEAGESNYRMSILYKDVMEKLLEKVTVEPITPEEAAALAVEEATTEAETVEEATAE